MEIKASEQIVNALIANGIVTSSEKELYAFGIKQGLLMILNVFTVIIMGLIMGMVWQSLVLLLAYIPIRTYAGGYHARTQRKCYLYSSLIMFIALIAIEWIPWTDVSLITVMLLSSSMIFCLAPVEDRNKPLYKSEKIVFRRRTRQLLSFVVALGLISEFFGYEGFSSCIVVAIALLAAMVVLGNLPKRIG